MSVSEAFCNAQGVSGSNVSAALNFEGWPRNNKKHTLKVASLMETKLSKREELRLRLKNKLLDIQIEREVSFRNATRGS